MLPLLLHGIRGQPVGIDAVVGGVAVAKIGEIDGFVGAAVGGKPGGQGRQILAPVKGTVDEVLITLVRTAGQAVEISQVSGTDAEG